MADRYIPIAESPKAQHRLGRHINHDGQSMRYLVPAMAAVPKTVVWERKIPVLDQGNLGACTAFATIGVLGTEPYYSTLPDEVKQALNGDYAVQLYREITRLDPYEGAWEPDDTGSDGLSAAKAATARSLISGYQHVTSLQAAHTAIQAGPFITGTMWLSNMEHPAADGHVIASGSVLGGHEYECFGYDLELDRWWFWNSWGPDWAKNGAFYMSSTDFTRLLAKDGDATTFVPLTKPAPVPAPVTPEPVPTPVAFPLAEIQPWLDKPRSWTKSIKAADAVKYWLSKQ